MTEHVGAVVLARKPGHNAYHGLIEQSFAMDWDQSRVRYWWSGPAYWGGMKVSDLDGREDAEEQARYYRGRHPDWDIEVWDVCDPALPIRLDWERHARLRNDKFENRNPAFEMN